MYAVLKMKDGKSQSYEVTEETYQKMKSDFLLTEHIRNYEIAPDGVVNIDWTKVESLKKSDRNPNTPRIA